MAKVKVKKSKPAKGKAKVKITASGKKVSYGQAGKAKGGGPRVKPGTSKGDAYCARSYGQMKRSPKAAKDPNSHCGCLVRDGNAVANGQERASNV